MADTIYGGWFKKASSDLRNVKNQIELEDETIPFDTLCFHCQQAVEKYLKGFLAYHTRAFPFTHSIKDLLELASEVDQGFLRFLARGEELTPYAVETRYPDDFYMPDREETQTAFETALEIETFVLGKLKE